MQLKLISLGLATVVFTTVVDAALISGGGNTDGQGVGAIINPATQVLGPVLDKDLLQKIPVKKRGLFVSKKVASSVRRRAFIRRGEEADEEEEDEDENENENEDEEQDSVEADSTEEESVADTVVNNEDIEETESENSEWERRSSVAGGLPIVGDILGGSQSTGEGSGGILGGL